MNSNFQKKTNISRHLLRIGICCSTVGCFGWGQVLSVRGRAEVEPEGDVHLEIQGNRVSIWNPSCLDGVSDGAWRNLDAV